MACTEYGINIQQAFSRPPGPPREQVADVLGASISAEEILEKSVVMDGSQLAHADAQIQKGSEEQT